MSISNTTIQLKKSGVSGNTPTSLNFGELALNYADGKLYYKDDSGTIRYIKNSNSFATVNANASLVLAESNSDTLTLTAANGIGITANTITKTITIDDRVTQDLVNDVYVYANSAYNQANTVGNLDIVPVAETDDNANNVFYVILSDTNSGSANTLFATANNASNNTLTFIPSAGKMGVKSIGLASNTIISSNSVFVANANSRIIDSFSTTEYKGAFYQVQMSSPDYFHSLNLTVIHDGLFPTITTFGEVYTGSLGSFSADIFGSNLDVIFTPRGDLPTANLATIVFIKNAIR